MKNLVELFCDVDDFCKVFIPQWQKQLLEDGANSIALMLDDIPNDFKKKFGIDISEGTYHAILANKLSDKLGQNIFFVPRVYADELISDWQGFD